MVSLVVIFITPWAFDYNINKHCTALFSKRKVNVLFQIIKKGKKKKFKVTSLSQIAKKFVSNFFSLSEIHCAIVPALKFIFYFKSSNIREYSSIRSNIRLLTSLFLGRKNFLENNGNIKWKVSQKETTEKKIEMCERV